MKNLESYATHLATKVGLPLKSGQVFAKVLTANDDSGRHGVLIPADAYAFFPALEILDPLENVTTRFASFDALSGESTSLAFKYYQRYPERRITRVNKLISDLNQGLRLQVVLRGETPNGQTFYVHDGANELSDGRFHRLWAILTSGALAPMAGTHLVVPIQFGGLTIDEPLQDLLNKFDAIQGRWFDSLRSGDTGIGYTFETLLGIQENNDKTADFRGIELKCKRLKLTGVGAMGKVNLFQQVPQWATLATSMERLKAIGQLKGDGLWACHSQVSTTENNLGFRLTDRPENNRIDIQKSENLLGYWHHQTLEQRLLEKHSRAAFILADTKLTSTGSRFCYRELIYCELPTVDRFLDLVGRNQLVFEFMMSEKSGGQVRNHGYPWRLVREDLLDQLFAVRVKLR